MSTLAALLITTIWSGTQVNVEGVLHRSSELKAGNESTSLVNYLSVNRAEGLLSGGKVDRQIGIYFNCHDAMLWPGEQGLEESLYEAPRQAAFESAARFKVLNLHNEVALLRKLNELRRVGAFKTLNTNIVVNPSLRDDMLFACSPITRQIIFDDTSLDILDFASQAEIDRGAVTDKDRIPAEVLTKSLARSKKLQKRITDQINEWPVESKKRLVIVGKLNHYASSPATRMARQFDWLEVYQETGAQQILVQFESELWSKLSQLLIQMSSEATAPVRIFVAGTKDQLNAIPEAPAELKSKCRFLIIQ